MLPKKIIIKKPTRKFSDTITITLGDVAENHVGMAKHGTEANSGFEISDLISAQNKFQQSGIKTQLINLNSFLPPELTAEEAAVLVIRDGLRFFDLTADKLYLEQKNLAPDTQYYDRRRKRVLNKNARHNLCFDETAQDCDIENGCGTVIAYSDVPLLQKLRNHLSSAIGPKGDKLAAEGNYYYDARMCGIGFHGDAERRRVFALRLGASIPLHYQWFHRFRPIGERVKIMLNHGDMYIMSSKAVGRDWRKSSILTLRHAAGADKYLQIRLK